MMTVLFTGFISIISLTLPDSLVTQCAASGQSVEDVTQNFLAIDSLASAYLRHIETHPDDTLGDPMRCDGLTPEAFCSRLGIPVPQSSLIDNRRTVYWGTTSKLVNDTKSGFFVAIVTPGDSTNLPELIVTIDPTKSKRHLSYIVPLPQNKSVSFEIEP